MIKAVKYYLVDNIKFTTLQQVADHLGCKRYTAWTYCNGQDAIFKKVRYIEFNGKKYPTQRALAGELGCTHQMVSMALKGQRSLKNFLKAG